MHKLPRFGITLTTLLVSMALPTWAASQTSSPSAPGLFADGTVPACPSHDPNAFHGVYDPVRRCHYSHEHHDDPSAVDDLFGPAGGWFGQSGQTVSYAWQTFGAQGMENNLKHEGYKWLVARDMPCQSNSTDHPGCFTAYRIQVHAIAGVMDATVRFHSFSMEAVACLGGRCGIIRHGGWNDFGHLALVVGNGEDEACPQLESNPPSFICGQGPRREHSSLEHSAYYATWYGNHEVTQPDVRFQEFGPIDFNDPNKQLFFCPDLNCAQNGSVMRIENLWAGLNYPWLNPDAGGVINFRGYTDRYGNLAQGCTAPAVDCVPLAIENLPVGSYFMRGDLTVDGAFHDMSPGGRSSGREWWIKFPN